MLSFMIFYLSIGIISNFIGPLAKRVNNITKGTRSTTISKLLKKPKVKKREDLFIEVVLRILTILFFPIIYIIIAIEFCWLYYPRPWLRKILNDHRLYYWRMGGSGTIRCLECDFEQNIISFLHGVDDWNRIGYQCQKCGKFQVIENDLHIPEVKKCECGGNIDREKPIFCPKCKTNHVAYDLKYIT